MLKKEWKKIWYYFMHLPVHKHQSSHCKHQQLLTNLYRVIIVLNSGAILLNMLLTCDGSLEILKTYPTSNGTSVPLSVPTIILMQVTSKNDTQLHALTPIYTIFHHNTLELASWQESYISTSHDFSWLQKGQVNCDSMGPVILFLGGGFLLLFRRPIALVRLLVLYSYVSLLLIYLVVVSLDYAIICESSNNATLKERGAIL